MWKKAIFIFLLSLQWLSAEEYDGYTYKDFDFSMITMRKAGTHLMKKFFYIISEELGHPEASRYYWDHCGSFRKGNLLTIRDQLLRDKPTLIIIRDLRDIVVSLVYYVEKWIDQGYFDRQYPQELLFKWRHLPMDKKIKGIILRDRTYPFVNGFLHEDYSQIENVLLNAKKALVIRYEDLVGTSGGGSDEMQKGIIEKICHFLNFNLTPDEMEYLCANFFGVRSQSEATGLCYTYNPDSQGKIGTWKKHFSPFLLKVMEAKYGSYLQKFGYDCKSLARS